MLTSQAILLPFIHMLRLSRFAGSLQVHINANNQSMQESKDEGNYKRDHKVVPEDQI